MSVLTENERRLGLEVASREGGETRRWLNLVLLAYDELLDAARDFVVNEEPVRRGDRWYRLAKAAGIETE